MSESFQGCYISCADYALKIKIYTMHFIPKY
ncbi:hypothetical protein J825_4003, partial [Acinetobacter baumannii 25691_2]